MKRTILYFSLSVVGAFWLAYALGYQQGYQRGGREWREMWEPVHSGGATDPILWRQKPQYDLRPSRAVNVGKEVTFSQPLKPGSGLKSHQWRE